MSDITAHKNRSASRKLFISVYRSVRKRFNGTGLSKYGALRNLNHAIAKRVYGKPAEFIFVGGFKLFLDPRQTLRDETFDDLESRIFKTLIRPGDLVVDVGAHVGWFSLIASRATGNTGKIFAFEPTNEAHALLLKNLKENQCNNVVVENAAISDTSGTCTIYTVGNLLHGSSIIDPRDDADFWITPHLADSEDKTIHELNVPMKTLDECFLNQRINFIKIDTEGNDGRVWAGMQKVIRNNPDIIVFMEFAPTTLQKFGTDADQLIRDIQGQGFHIFMTEGHYIKPYEKTPGFSGDILFTKKDIHKDILNLDAK